ncbi:hypothetical protein B0H11DRAFT_1928211 [Mycena galericulata]|nr:hypothetical protein B0H11DRAFT_1928211 [Mycena galericulata]
MYPFPSQGYSLPIASLQGHTEAYIEEDECHHLMGRELNPSFLDWKTRTGMFRGPPAVQASPQVYFPSSMVVGLISAAAHSSEHQEGRAALFLISRMHPKARDSKVNKERNLGGEMANPRARIIMVRSKGGFRPIRFVSLFDVFFWFNSPDVWAFGCPHAGVHREMQPAWIRQLGVWDGQKFFGVSHTMALPLRYFGGDYKHTKTIHDRAL